MSNTEENIVTGKYMEITISGSIPEYYRLERLQDIIGDSKYIERKVLNEIETKRLKHNVFDSVYTFREIPDIYELTLGPYYINITFTKRIDVDEHLYMDIIKRLFERDLEFIQKSGDDEIVIKNKAQMYYNFIRNIICVTGETFCARTYAELKESGNITNLHPELKEHEYSLKHITTGTLNTAEYEAVSELSRCQASFFNMEKAMDFRRKITVESLLTGMWLKSLDDIVDSIRRTVTYAQNILNDEKEIEIPDNSWN